MAGKPQTYAFIRGSANSKYLLLQNKSENRDSLRDDTFLIQKESVSDLKRIFEANIWQIWQNI